MIHVATPLVSWLSKLVGPIKEFKEKSRDIGIFGPGHASSVHSTDKDGQALRPLHQTNQSHAMYILGVFLPGATIYTPPNPWTGAVIR
jgi:hypothetical protein